MSGEKRLQERKRLDIEVIFEDENKEGIIKLRSMDLSSTGIFIKGDIPIRVGSNTFLSFKLPDSETLYRLVGEVVRVANDGGMGVRFIDPPRNVISEFETFLAALH